MERRKTIILGAAGRDFQNFNVFFRNNPSYEVVCFTAAQITGIAGRKYPPKLAGKLYRKGIPIIPEEKLAQEIKKKKVKEVVLAYSDLSNEEVMHKAQKVLAAGASFTLLGPKDTMIESKKQVIAVCAVRTGAGKSQTTRYIADILIKHGKRVAAIRHPMPYGNLEKQEVQRFKSYKDLEKHNTTIEEREEYEPLIKKGITVFAGVDYEKILRKAEKEADIVLWDGGNNDFPFYKPDLMFVVADPLRAGHEVSYYPGEACFRMADCIIINKCNSAEKKDIEKVEANAGKANPKAEIVKANSVLFAQGAEKIRGKKVLVIEDGPTLTHGGMKFGAGTVIAKKFCAKMVSPEKYASGSIKEAFRKYSHLKNILPALGYNKKELKEMQEILDKMKVDYVVVATPIDLEKVLRIRQQIVRVKYELEEIGKKRIGGIIKKSGLI